MYIYVCIYMYVYVYIYIYIYIYIYKATVDGVGLNVLGVIHLQCKISYTKYSRTPLIRTPVIRIADYPDQLGPSGKFV